MLLSIFVWLPAALTARVLAVRCMTSRQAEQDLPDASQVALHNNNKINLSVGAESLSLFVYSLHSMGVHSVVCPLNYPINKSLNYPINKSRIG
jgi:hypothetical protein